MIIPKRDAKSYGAVHIDYFLTFVGFCKKVSSDEIQSIDVFIDGNKIDTIVCDKTIDKVSQIYDIEGHGFEYDLPEVYFDKRHLLSFRCSDRGEELVNSPISTICKDDEKFNEYKFLNSLSKPIDEEKIKDMYCPNSIGFLAVEENLNDKDFVEYIKELYNRFPQVTFKAFYFSDNQKKLGYDYFGQLVSKKFELLEINSVYYLIGNVELYIHCGTNRNIGIFNLLKLIISKCNNIFSFPHSMSYQGKVIKDYDNMSNSILFDEPARLNYSEQDILYSKLNPEKLIYNTILKHIDVALEIKDETDAYSFIHFERLRLVFMFKEFKKNIIKTTKIIWSNI